MSNEPNTVPDYRKEAVREIIQAEQIIHDFLSLLPPDREGRHATKAEQIGPAFVATAKVLWRIAERHAMQSLGRGDHSDAVAILDSWRTSVFVGNGQAKCDSLDEKHKREVEALRSVAETMKRTIIACRN